MAEGDFGYYQFGGVMIPAEYHGPIELVNWSVVDAAHLSDSARCSGNRAVLLFLIDELIMTPLRSFEVNFPNQILNLRTLSNRGTVFRLSLRSRLVDSCYQARQNWLLSRN